LRLWWKRPLRRFGLSTRDWTTSSSRAVCCLRASHAPSWTADVSVSWTIGAWRLRTGQGPHPGPVVGTTPSWTQTVTTTRQWLGPRPSRSGVSICGQYSIPTPVQPGKSLESNIQFVTSQIQNPIHCLCNASIFAENASQNNEVEWTREAEMGKAEFFVVRGECRFMYIVTSSRLYKEILRCLRILNAWDLNLCICLFPLQTLQIERIVAFSTLYRKKLSWPFHSLQT